MSFYPIPAKKYGQESKVTRPTHVKTDKTLKKTLPQDRSGLILCPRVCQQHRTPSGRLLNGMHTYDPVKKYCYKCGLKK